MQPATIKLFLVKGSPNSLRTAEISNWTGKAIAAPRSELNDFLKRDEVDNPGIYFLTGTDPETGESALYIGEAESVRIRIKGHADRDFWVAVTAIVSKDENLTKAHIRYLEGRLIDIAKNHTSAILMNSASSGSKLPEPDTAEMGVFLDNIFQLLPVLGISHFNRVVEKPTPQENLLFCKIKGLKATGKRTSNGFIVYKGSQAVLEHRPSAKSIRVKREELVKKGLLVKTDSHLLFMKDLEFTSPSMAGGVIRGGNTNGLTNWKNREGTTLKDIEAN